MPMFHEGNRELQERFGARPLADRLVERLRRDRFTDDDRAFIESVGFFFLATANSDGHPDCSFKGGPAGFVSVPFSSEPFFTVSVKKSVLMPGILSISMLPS